MAQPENKIKKKISGRSKGEITSSAARGAAGLTAASFAAFCFSFVEAKADPGVPLLPQQPSPRDRKWSSCERDCGLFRCDEQRQFFRIESEEKGRAF